MGVCLYFTSTAAVDPGADEAIRADLRQSGNGQPWVLCEPPHFYPTDADGKLRGRTKLNLHPWPDEQAEAANVPAERNDLQELLRFLCASSERHQIAWELSIDDMPLGRIEGGVCDSDVEGTLEALADVSEYLGEEFPDDGPEGPPGGSGLRIWPGPE